MTLEYKNKTSRILLLILSFSIMAALNGCSEEKHKSSEQKISNSSVANSPKIEIVTNKNAQVIKVDKTEETSAKNSSYYYDYGEKKEYNQNTQRTEIDANMNVRSPYEHVQVSMLVKKLSKNFILRCSPCHNDYANGIIGPSLLGRDSSYIYNKIMDFKSGKKVNPLMNDLIKMMNDNEIKSMADEIYQFNKEITQMRNKK